MPEPAVTPPDPLPEVSPLPEEASAPKPAEPSVLETPETPEAPVAHEERPEIVDKLPPPAATTEAAEAEVEPRSAIEEAQPPAEFKEPIQALERRPTLPERIIEEAPDRIIEEAIVGPLSQEMSSVEEGTFGGGGGGGGVGEGNGFSEGGPDHGILPTGPGGGGVGTGFGTGRGSGIGSGVGSGIGSGMGSGVGSGTGSGAGPGEGVAAPIFDADYLNNPAPRYPARARKLKLEGTVIVRVSVNPEGKPEVVRIERTSGASILDSAALRAVENWLFVPARRGGLAVSAWVDVPIRFRLQ